MYRIELNYKQVGELEYNKKKQQKHTYAHTGWLAGCMTKLFTERKIIFPIRNEG